MIFLVGMNHKTAPIALREKFSIPDLQYQAFSAFLAGEGRAEGGSGGGIREQVVLSTCNRTEVYGSAEDPEAAMRHVVEAFANFSDEPKQIFLGHAYRRTGADAVQHLFAVTAGMDSMALGETEILGQVKNAYLKAHAAQRTSRCLNALFQRALRVGKKVRTETAIGAGKVSVASIAVDLALKIFSSLKNKRVLLIGSGQMARAVCESLIGKGVKELVVANRNTERAEGLVEEFGGRAVPFERLDEEAVSADIVISSAGTPAAFIHPDRVEKWMKRKSRTALFLIDLGVPRNIDEQVNELADAYLYNLDDLQAIAERNSCARQMAVAACQSIVEAASEQFLTWLDGAPSHSDQHHAEDKHEGK
jgi:glutamyl-tRNA reductase